MRNSLSRFTENLADALESLAGKLFGGGGQIQKNRQAALLGGRKTSLVKDRPASLEQRYRPVQADDIADAVFARLQRHVYMAVDASTQSSVRTRGPVEGRIVFREAGKLAVKGAEASADGYGAPIGRLYFYLKPAGRKGWLFERSGSGWVVARAEKDALRGLFLRDSASLDQVTLYMAPDSGAFPRVRSRLLGGDLLSFAVYEQKLLQLIECES